MADERKPGQLSKWEIERRLAVEKGMKNIKTIKSMFRQSNSPVSKIISANPYESKLGQLSQSDIEKRLMVEKSIENQKKEDSRATLRVGEAPRSFGSKASAILINPMTALEYKLRGKNIPDYFDRGPKNVLEHAVNLVNPFGYANAVGSIPGNLADGEFLQAGLNTLTAIPLLSEVPGLSQEVREFGRALNDLPKARNFKESMARMAGIPMEHTLPRMPIDEVKAFRQIQEIGRLKSINNSMAEQMRYGLSNNLPENHFQKIFNRSRAEAQNLLDNGFGENNPIRSGTINLRRDPSRVSRGQIPINGNEPGSPEWVALHDEINTGRESIRNTGRANRIQELADHYRDLINEDDFAASDFIIPTRRNGIQKLNTTLQNLDNKSSTFINNLIQEYPYSPNVIEKVPSLNLAGSGSLKNVSKKVNFAPDNINSGDVFTGSTNTSHSSWLPQIKQVFKYDKGDPQFLGYTPMNSMGYLSYFEYESDDIAKYLNSELDEQIKRGVIPSNIQRPYKRGEHVILPQYGIKQHALGGETGKQKNPYTKRDLYNYLFPKEQEEVTNIIPPTAPSVEEIEQPKEEIDDGSLEMAMSMGLNPYQNNTRTVSEQADDVNPYAQETRNEILSNMKGVRDLGIWGDEAHQRRKSDHNTGDAWDAGIDAPEIGETLVNKLQKEAKERNIKYIIYNGKIWNPSVSDDWRPYTGPDKHTDHAHISYNR